MADIKKGSRVSIPVSGVVVATSKDEVIVAVTSQTVHCKPEEVEEAPDAPERQANPALDSFRKQQEGGQN